eukprot:353183-Chlamydomonas_euryale.AAC.7
MSFWPTWLPMATLASPAPVGHVGQPSSYRPRWPTLDPMRSWPTEPPTPCWLTQLPATAFANAAANGPLANAEANALLANPEAVWSVGQCSAQRALVNARPTGRRPTRAPRCVDQRRPNEVASPLKRIFANGQPGRPGGQRGEQYQAAASVKSLQLYSLLQLSDSQHPIARIE